MTGWMRAPGKPPATRPGTWSGVVLAKYWALQLPATALLIVVLLPLANHFGWPQWIVWTIVALWVAKDAILYPFVWRSYVPSDPTALPYPMDGATGVAVECINRSGMVQVAGELWRAELPEGTPPINEGEAVQVVSRKGLTLMVRPGSPDSGAE